MFNVIDILRRTSVGKSIVTDFISNGERFVTAADRQEVVRICVQHLVSLPSGYYPSAEIKEKMAKAITVAFPPLAYKEDVEEGVSEYCHFYHPTTPGFLDQRLKTVRKTLDLTQRKRKVNKSPGGEKKKQRKSNTRKGCDQSHTEEVNNADIEQHLYEVSVTPT